MKRVSAFYKPLNCLLIFLLCGCGPGQAPKPLSTLQAGCTAPGTIISADLPQPTRGYTYNYRVYLPPCYAAKTESRYPILYLIPGRTSSPDTWFAAGLAEVVDRMILHEEIPPFLIVTTQNIEDDPLAETIYNELMPHIENQYPILTNRQYRAVAGGSLGGIAAYRLAFQHPDTFSSAGIFGAGAVSGEEIRITEWLTTINEKHQIRVFMDTGDADMLMLERAEVMKSILDEAGIENILQTSRGGHNYAYWVGNFEIYLRWLVKTW